MTWQQSSVACPVVQVSKFVEPIHRKAGLWLANSPRLQHKQTWRRILTLKSIDSIRRKLLTNCSRERDDNRVTTLDSRGAAKFCAIVDVDALRGDVGGEEE
jgi:hypothetical protein